MIMVHRWHRQEDLAAGQKKITAHLLWMFPGPSARNLTIVEWLNFILVDFLHTTSHAHCCLPCQSHLEIHHMCLSHYEGDENHNFLHVLFTHSLAAVSLSVRTPTMYNLLLVSTCWRYNGSILHFIPSFLCRERGRIIVLDGPLTGSTCSLYSLALSLFLNIWFWTTTSSA
jgi:hypothetical protein